MPSVEIVERGNSKNLVCKASGWPAPSLSWSKNGKKIHNGSYSNSYKIEQRDVNTLDLGILRASNHHHGTYTCRAHNLFGTSTQDINIMIKRKLRFAANYFVRNVKRASYFKKRRE